MYSKDLKNKIEIATNNIVEWYEYWDGKVYVAFSGGKDSIAMLHLVRSIYSDVPAVYFHTGLDWPECVQIVKETQNVVILKPKMAFHKVIKHYGWPIVSKNNAKKLREVQRATQKHGNYNRNRRLLGNKFDRIPAKHRYLIMAPFKINDKCCDIMKKEPAWEYVKKPAGCHMWASLKGILGLEP